MRKIFHLKFSNIQLLDEEYATCNWTATYTFSKTGKKVVNNIKAYMKLKDGIIIEHSDAFRLSTWIGTGTGLERSVIWLDRIYEKSGTERMPAGTCKDLWRKGKLELYVMVRETRTMAKIKKCRG